MNFADRVVVNVKKKRSHAVIGLDPVVNRIPALFLERAKRRYGISPRGAAAALFDFNKTVIDLVAPHVAIVKPQLAYYEVYGAAGMDAFWETVKYARAKGLMTIADAKRGDITSTAEAYRDAFFGPSGGPEWMDAGQTVDSLTINPYMGRDSVEPFVSEARHGLFVLVKTSNPSAGDLQELVAVSGRKQVSDHAADLVNELGKPHLGEFGYSSIGAVVGALYPEDLKRYRRYMRHSIFLVPGYGSQGGTAQDIVHAFNEDGLGALVNASRSILYPAGTRVDSNIEEIQLHIVQAVESMNNEINQILNAQGKLVF